MPSDILEDRIRARLSSRKTRKILRSLTEPNHALIDFSSNDYLGLATNAELRQHFLDRLASPQSSSASSSSGSIGEDKDNHVLGAGGSRLLDGNTRAHVDLESRLEIFFGSPKGGALLHNSGYDANVGLFSCLPQREDYVVYDSLIHASVHDGMKASRVPVSSRISFRHNSLEDLERILLRLTEENSAVLAGRACVFVAVEALYSMDGDLAPLDAVLNLVERMLPSRNGYLIVDEAHSSGVYGPNGRGLVAHLGLEDRILVRLHTFGKALASNGAAVLTTPSVRNYLINYSRPLIYTTALAIYNAVAVQCSLDMLERPLGNELSIKVLTLAEYFHAQIRALLPQINPSLVSLAVEKPMPYSRAAHLKSPIIPILTPYPRDLSAHLRTFSGILARPITHPTVPKGEERVRVCIHSNNSWDEVDRLVRGIIGWAKEWNEVAVEERRERARL